MLPLQPRDAVAGVPAETHEFRAYGQVEVESRTGSEMVDISGSVTVERTAASEVGGQLEFGIEVVSVNLTGQSALGTLQVDLSPVSPSTGLIRGTSGSPDQFPAEGTLDAFISVAVPISPPPSPLDIMNLSPIQMTADAPVTEWPVIQTTFVSEPLRGVDNDGDTLIDEDTSDEDGDHLYDEDHEGRGPDHPRGNGCTLDNNPLQFEWDADCDGTDGEDPPGQWCIDNASAACDDDGDSLIDEDPDCTPLFMEASGQYFSMPIGACVVSMSLALEYDTDKDGCTDAQEMQTAPGSEVSGGLRDPNNFWDFFDTPDGANNRDRSIGFGDVVRVLMRAGSSGNPMTDPLSPPDPAPAYHTALDRSSPPPGQNVWNLGAPDGSIGMADVVMVLYQVPHTCAT